MRRRAALLALVLLFLIAFPARTQQWEIGGAGGYGVYRKASVTASAGSADVGFANQAAGGLVIGENLYRRIGGEFRYTYRGGDLKATSGGQEATLGGRAHAIHYDFLFHASPRGSRIRPFVAAGAGIKVYQGTGRESAVQPLSRLVLLTKTDQVEPLISFGGGVKFLLSKHAQFRVDFRDYASPTPDRLFVPGPGGKLHGWLHDFVPMAGLSFVF